MSKSTGPRGAQAAVAALTLFLVWVGPPFPAAAAEAPGGAVEAGGGSPAVAGASRLAKMHFFKGSMLEKRQALALALKEYEAAFSYDPKSAFICQQAARVALEIDSATAAESWVARLAAIEPDGVESKMLRGRVLWASGRMDEAEGAFQEALKLDPKSSETVLALGGLLAARSPEKAKQLFARYMDDNPDDAAEAHYQIGLLEFRGGNPKEAEKHLRAAAKLEPDSSMVLYGLAELYMVAKDTDAALAEYIEILELEPDNAELLVTIGEIYRNKGLLDEARVKFEAAKYHSPGDPAASLYLSQIWEAKGDFAKAAEELRTSSALKDDLWLNLRLSYFLTQAEKLKEAVAVLENARRRWPDNDEVAYYLALGLDDLKLAPKAVALLRAILARKPDYRDARYQLAVVLERSGRMDQAEKEFRSLIAANPNDAGILNYLGYSLADRGKKLDDAEELIDQAVSLDPKNGAYQDSLGWVYFRQGRSTEAVRELSAAARKLPEDGTIWDHLGDAYSKSGDAEKAWRAWMRAQALEPGDLKFGKKAEKTAEGFPPANLAGFFMDHFAAFLGGIEKYSGLCEVKMSFVGKAFTYSGLLTFRDGELSMDILGPLFMPVMRARLGAEGFTMDPIRIEGVRTDALMDEAFKAFQALHDYLSGRAFEPRPVLYGKSWFNRWVDTPDWRLVLSSDGLKVERLEPKDKDGVYLTLGDFIFQRGRQVPSRLSLDGRGFRLVIKMKDLKPVFK
ncbi:MAG: tetratricopeptide repeat protein [Elusimicrobia bacterium]|nr:tetratricopeptide repeat protein [Elusimicrobiota bacterium]